MPIPPESQVLLTVWPCAVGHVWEALTLEPWGTCRVCRRCGLVTPKSPASKPTRSRHRATDTP